LGADVRLVGTVGDDDLGREAKSALESEGVDLAHVSTGGKHTGVAQILVDGEAENMIAVAPGANVEMTTSSVVEALEAIDAEDAVVLSVLEIPEEAVTAGAQLSRERGWRFVLTPAPARPLDPELVGLCDVLTPNEHEVRGLGFSSPEEILEAGAKAVVVTKGRGGAELLRPGVPSILQPAFECRAVDTTGAGDAFTGALAWALAEGRSLETAVRVGAAAGALATEAIGARTSPTKEQLLARLDEDPTRGAS
jgi:ribokinase